MKSFHIEAKHPCYFSPGGRGELLAGYICITAFWVNWSLPTDLLSCLKCLLPSFLELLQLFLEGDPVERIVIDREQLGSLTICQQLTAKFQHPEVMMRVVEGSEEELILQ